jgi:L-Ala-D/L-Glu epimerase
MTNRLVRLELYHLRLPFRRRFVHAAARREGTDTVVAAAVLADGTIGYGEGLPREYVTGETAESMIANIRGCLSLRLGKLEPGTFAELLDVADNLPFVNESGVIINAARCCVELALLDAYGKHFRTNLGMIGGWLGFGRLAGGEGSGRCRVSGVLDGSTPEAMLRRYRLMRCYGFRDFKLKMGMKQDEAVLEVLERKLHGPMRDGRVTLRVDANGAWDVDTALGMCERLSRLAVVCVEQPLSAEDRSHWRMLSDLSPMPLMADESLVSLDDARYLIENDLADYFNIRISKNGGLLASIRLAELANKGLRQYQLGAMVGETSLLAAAGWHFLRIVPMTAFTEIGYGRFLLDHDIVERDVRFGYGGRLRKIDGPGLGVEVRPDRIKKFIVGNPYICEL